MSEVRKFDIKEDHNLFIKRNKLLLRIVTIMLEQHTQIITYMRSVDIFKV